MCVARTIERVRARPRARASLTLLPRPPPKHSATDPNFILAAYYHAAKTGDRATVARWMPTLTRVVDYMLQHMGVNETSLLTNMFPDCNGTWGVPLTPGPPLADNWFDDVRFVSTDRRAQQYCAPRFP